MTAEDPPVDTPSPGAAPQPTPQGAAGSPPAAPPPSNPPLKNSPAENAGSPPIAEINLPDQPELDRNPQAFGKTIDESKKTIKAGSGDAESEKTIKAGSGDGGSAFTEVDLPRELARDATRQTISLWLIGLLCSIVGLTFVALFARGASTGFTDKAFFSELKQVLDVLLGPVITLLASAIGFYFGYKQGELGLQAMNNMNNRVQEDPGSRQRREPL